MEPRLLYQASFVFQPVWLLLAVLFAVFLTVAICFAVKVRKSKEDEKKKKTRIYGGMVIGIIGTVFLLFSMAIVIPDQIGMYQATVVKYQNGEYEIAEGYVENFHPMPWGGHDQESFQLDGVEFSYSDYTVQFGYHNARSHGGVITGDGQHLRIGYTNYGWLGNVIVYIEELP